MTLSGRQPTTNLAASGSHPNPSPLKIAFALVAVYLVWGSTYLAIRVALESFPPFLMCGIRFVIAGVLLYVVMRMRGAPAPTPAQWRASAVIGTLLMGGGTGAVAFAEQWVASGLAALEIATTPLWAALFAGIWGRWPSRLEWTGLVLGLLGVGLLNLEGNLRGSPAGAAALLLAPICWTFGSIWSRHLPIPSGLMASATKMLTGGAVLLLFGMICGESLPSAPSGRAVGAVIYLIVFGSLVAFSAYLFLLEHTRPALATSYAYVNPVIAVILGWWLAAEPITGRTLVAAAIIIAAVVLITLHQVHEGIKTQRMTYPTALVEEEEEALESPDRA